MIYHHLGSRDGLYTAMTTLDLPPAGATPRTVTTTALLACGAIAGPLFTLAWAVEGATRAHHNPVRHPGGWATYSAATGVVFAVAFVLTSMAFNQVGSLVEFGGLLQRLTITVGWTWLTLLAAHLLRGGPESPGRTPT
jgi:hypothetical protein